MATIVEPSRLTEQNSDGTVNTGAIPNALPAPVMRRCMENKNLLAQKGAVYVGTGKTYAVTDNTADLEYNTAETVGISPSGGSTGNTNAGYILFCADPAIVPSESNNYGFPQGVTPTLIERKAGVKWITLQELKNALNNI